MYRLYLVLILLIVAGCGSNSEYTSASKASDLDLQLINALIEASPNKEGPEFFTMPTELDKIPQDPNNPITSAKVILGEKLFNETQLATQAKNAIGLGTYSCASCHHQQLGFQAGLPQGIGEGGVGDIVRAFDSRYRESDADVQPVRSPTVLNIAYQEIMLWNGQFGALGVNQDTISLWKNGTLLEFNMLGFSGVETQAIAGMHVHRLSLKDSGLENDNEYKILFKLAFPNEINPFTDLNAALAIAVFERSLLSINAPFQSWLRGSYSSLSKAEKEGALLFFTKANCFTCHTGPALSSNTFHALGMKDLDQSHKIIGKVPENTRLGRGGFTNKYNDNFKFKTPQLYDLVKSPFYGHGSSFTTIEQVVRYKNKGIKENSLVPNEFLSSQFKPLNLSEKEILNLSLFLEKSLKE